MHKISTSMLPADVGEALERVTAEGGVILIEHEGRPVAALVTAEHFEDWREAAPALAEIDDSTLYQWQAPATPSSRAGECETCRLYEETAEIARIGHWEWDPIVDRCTYCSPQHAQIYGLTVAAFLERASSIGGYMSLVHPEDRLTYQRSVQRYRREKTQTEIEHRIVRDDGTVVPVRVSIHPVLDRDGAIVRSYGILQDISALRQSEESRQRSEAFLRQAGRIARFGTWIWDDVEDRLVYGSTELAEILEHTPERLLQIGSSWASYLAQVHPDDRAGYEAQAWQAAETCRAYDVVYRVRTGSGAYRHVREIGEPVFDKRGHHRRTLGSLLDVDESIRAERAVGEAREALQRMIREGIERLSAAQRALRAETSARERAEAALRESEARLRAVVDHSPSAIFMKDREGRFQWVNASFLEWYGLTPEEVIGKASQELSTASRISTYAQLNVRVLETGGVLEHDIEVPFADGRLRPIHIVKFPVRGADGETLGVGTIQRKVAR